MLQYPYMTTNHFIPSLESHHIGACLDVTRQCKMQVQSECWNILDMFFFGHCCVDAHGLRAPLIAYEGASCLYGPLHRALFQCNFVDASPSKKNNIYI